MKKLILIIGPPPDPPLPGGIATGIKMMLESDLKYKYEFIMLNRLRKDESGSILLNLRAQLDGILRLFIILARRRPNLVHIKRGSVYKKRNLLTTLSHLLVSKLFFRKVILQMHGSGFESYCNGEDSLGKILLKTIFALSARVIVLNHYWKQNFSKLVRREKIGIVSNGVVLRKLRPKKNARTSLGLAQDCDLLFFIGDLSRQKGVYDILKAIPIIINRINSERAHNVLFAGAGPYRDRNALDELKAICKKAKIESNVAFLGTASGNRKDDLFAASDIFILPSYAENMPNSILEAMEAGLPIITSNVGGIPEVIEEGKNGFLIKPGDYEGLARKIIKLIESTRLRKRIGDNNRIKIERKYNFSIIADMLDKEYRNLIKLKSCSNR